MAFTRNSDATNTIASLPTDPNSANGYPVTTLKASFDTAAVNYKAYLNNTLLPELDNLDGITVAIASSPEHIHSIAPNSAETNVSIAIKTKGTGSILQDVGGNARGDYAIDLQNQRSADTQVASGDDATIIGGYYNTASGVASTVVGGAISIASGNFAVILGGGESEASGEGSIALGYQAKAHGEFHKTFGAGKFTTIGDAQETILVNRIETTDGAGTDVWNGSHKVIPTNTVWRCVTNVVGYEASTGDVYSVTATCTLKNIATTVSQVGSSGYDNEMKDQAWTLTVGPDNANKTLLITATGEVGKTIHWVARTQITVVA